MSMRSKLLTPQSMIDDEADFANSREARAAAMVIQNLLPMLQAIQNALDLQLQLESGFLKRKDMKERFEQFYEKVAEELIEQKVTTEALQEAPVAETNTDAEAAE